MHGGLPCGSWGYGRMRILDTKMSGYLKLELRHCCCILSEAECWYFFVAEECDGQRETVGAE